MTTRRLWVGLGWFSRRLILAFLAVVVVYGVLSSILYFQTLDTKTPTAPRKSITENQKQRQPEKTEIQLSREDEKEIDRIVSEAMQLKSNKQWAAALAVLDAGLLRFPTSDKLTTHKGGWYFDQGNWSMAQKYYEEAHKLNPREPAYPMNVALCLSNQHKDAEVGKWYQIAYDIRPSTGQLIALVSNLWKFNNWTNYDVYVQKILNDIRKDLADGKSVPINSYIALHLPFTLADLQGIAASESKKIGEQARRESQGRKYVHRPQPGDANRRIRVGYVSYDFRQHAVGLQVQSIFGFHDRSRFEVFAYNTNDGLKDPFSGSPVYEKISKEVEHMVQLGSPPVAEAADRIYNDSIDILIDLGLFTAYHRMDIFALKPAPIQVAYLGLATTTGAPWMDYLIADSVVIPDRASAQFYTENIVYMPHQYHVFDHKQMYGLQPKADRTQMGYSEDQFIYCNHANNQRLSPNSFPHWANIIKKVANSTLVLKYYNEESAANIKKEAIKLGLRVTDDKKTSQLSFMPGAGGAAHIGMKAICDVYLDVHYYNGHSTGGDMLWAGVPMVTYPGSSMASRAGASFAMAAGFPEMIATSWSEYESLAIEYAMNREAYRDLREQIERTRMTMPLFDTKRWVRNLETAFEAMYERYINGEPPTPLRGSILSEYTNTETLKVDEIWKTFNPKNTCVKTF